MAVLTGQDADPQITYKTVAVPLSRALEDVNKLVGTHYKASPQIQNEIVVVRIDKVPASSFKAKLASAVVGSWTKLDDGSELLSADAVARAAATREAEKKRLAEIEDGLKKLRESLNPKKPPQKSVDGDAPAFFEGEFDSSSRLIAHLSTSLRASEVAQLGRGDRVVYSTNANAMQRRLNVANLASIMAEFVQQHNATVTNESTEMSDPAVAAQLEKVKAVLGDFMPQRKKIEQPPAKLLFVVERGGMFGFMGDLIQLHAIAYDATGNVLATASDSLGGNPMRAAVASADVELEPTEGEAKPPETTPKTAENQDKSLEKPVELSPLATEFKSVLNFGSTGVAQKPVSPELMEQLLRPDQYDPLSFEASENLLALAAAKSYNLVALVPDGRMDFGTFARSGQSVTLATVKHDLESSEELKVTSADGWLLVSPVDPEAARLARLDRKALSQFLVNARNSGVPSLESLAAYAAVNPPFTETPVAMSHIMLIAPNAIASGMQGVQDWPMLRLYGLMTVTERQSLRAGQTIGLTSFSAKAQTVLKQMVFGAGAKFRVGPDPQSMFGMFAGISMGELRMNSFKEEPTEVMPNGLASGAVLKLELKPGHFIMTKSDAPGMFGMMMGAMGPEEYAMFKYMSEEPNMAQFTAMMPKIDKFRLGERETMDFRIIAGADISQKHTLVSNKIAKEAATIGPDGLPADFLAEVDKQMKLYKEGLGPLMQMGQMFGGRDVPPRAR